MKKSTGKTWARWFAILDRAGARKMNHAAIARYLSDEQSVPDWWCQMVTVGYERARGLRRLHQRPDGYSISVSRTVGMPAAKLFDAWSDARARARWLPQPKLTIRKATRPKSLRITWSDRQSSLEVNFYARGAAKAQVSVQHSKLADAKAAAKMKGFWSKTLDRMRERLER